MTVRLVTAIMVVVVGLSFLFAFGNVWLLALRLGVSESMIAGESAGPPLTVCGAGC
ncbi:MULTISPECIES: hypothetical protein [Frankia]|uniref:Uncharacterized protein n=1 Tax=Frankia alni (strain DSM 45986 / CECT 9034 / ACN14a) TaxID=326424 RepID=Q0RGR6_FRAAA|nr:MULTISPECIES: hypothetical protein [Frankia]CAJ63320.1 hypothetical protein FRAAL4678 [Frankia alni ACN14a]